LRCKIDTLPEGCHLSLDTRNPERTKQRVEDALRRLVQDGLVRLEWQGRGLDASNAELASWTAACPAGCP
jgi:hypothetical protein